MHLQRVDRTLIEVELVSATCSVTSEAEQLGTEGSAEFSEENPTREIEITSHCFSLIILL
jgi:hypothetical protein